MNVSGRHGNMRQALVVVGSLFLLLLAGCRFYYKSTTVNPLTPGKVQEYVSGNKYFVLHADSSQMHLDVSTSDSATIGGSLSKVPVERLEYPPTSPKSEVMRYRFADRSIVLDQVHLYLKDGEGYRLVPGDTLTLRVAGIDLARVYRVAVGRTVISWLWPPVVTFLGVSVLYVSFIYIIIYIIISSFLL